MAKLNQPVDHMFRAGQISSKNWSRLSMKQPGKGLKTKGRMANFDDKYKSDNRIARHGVSTTRSAHIDAADQGASAKGAFTQPTKGGFVGRASGKPDASDLPEKFPRQGSGRTPRQSYGAQQPSSSNYPARTKGNEQYGSKNSRPNKPSRLGRAETGGSKF